jgi:hypothetical protein
MLDEGSVYNSQLWEYSLLRLNQLEYFDPLKVDQDSEAHQDAEAGTVDLLLKVKEKGKNSIGLNGGVSGLSGAFLGVNYQTNNFLGLGETLSLQATWATSARSSCSASPSPTCATARSTWASSSSTTSRTTTPPSTTRPPPGRSPQPESAAQQSLTQNYNQASTGLNFSVSYPLKRHAFQRVGMTYSSTSPPSPPSRPRRRPSSRPSASAPAFRAPTRWPASSTARIVQLHLQHHQQPPAPAHRQGILGGIPGGRHRRQRALHLAFRGLQALHAHALPHPRRPMDATSWACARSWAMCRASAATWPRPTTASTPAAKAICAASISAAQRPTATSQSRHRPAHQS